MTKVMTFSGALDDLIYYSDTAESPTEDANGNPLDEASHFDFGGWVVGEGPTRFRVLAHYHGTWSFSIARFGEDSPFPDVKAVFMEGDRGYTTELHITVPDDTPVALNEYNKGRP